MPNLKKKTRQRHILVIITKARSPHNKSQPKNNHRPHSDAVRAMPFARSAPVQAAAGAAFAHIISPFR